MFKFVQAGLIGLACLAGATSAQALTTATGPIAISGQATLEVEGNCTNTGSSITLGPTIVIHDVPVEVIFDGGGSHDDSKKQAVDLEIKLASELTLPKQPAESGVTGNPLISIKVGDQLLLRPVRCNKL